MLKCLHRAECCWGFLPPEAAVAPTCHPLTGFAQTCEILLFSNTYMHKLTWGRSCSALWIWGSAWRRSRLPADTVRVWCRLWSWTCRTWPGITRRMSRCCCYRHLEGKDRVQCGWLPLRKPLVSCHGTKMWRLIQERGRSGEAELIQLTWNSITSTRSNSLYNWRVNYVTGLLRWQKKHLM